MSIRKFFSSSRKRIQQQAKQQAEARRGHTKRMLLLESLEERKLLAAIIGITNISPNRSDTAAIDPNGASGGRVNGLASVPGNNQIFFAASEWGGINKSIDQGKTWTHLSGHIPQATWDIEVDASNSNRIYATSFYDSRVNPITGIQVSNDGGKSWAHPLTAHPDPALEGTANDNTPQATYTANPTLRGEPSAMGISVRSDAPANVAVGTNAGLALSNDSGATWRIVDPTPATSASTIWDAVWHPGGANGIIDIIGDDGHLRSTDGGATFTASAGAVPAGAMSIAVSPIESYNLFVAHSTGLFESTDAGATWTNLGNPNPQGRIPFVETNPITATTFDVWFGDVRLHRGTATAGVAMGGAPRLGLSTTGWGATDFSKPAGAHHDAGTIVFDRTVSLNAAPILYSNDGGVYRNTNSTQSPAWEQPKISPHGHWLYGFTGVDQPGLAAEDIYYGTQDTGAFAQINAGATLTTLQSGVTTGVVNESWHNEFCCDVFDVAADNDTVIQQVGFFSVGRGFRMNLSNRGSTVTNEINTYPGNVPANATTATAGGELTGFKVGVVSSFTFGESFANWGDDAYAAVTRDDGVFGDGGLHITLDIKANPIVWTELVGTGGDEPWNSAQGVEVQVSNSGGGPTFFVQVGGGNGNSSDQIWRYIGTSGTASTWTRLDNTIPGATGVSEFAASPSNPNLIYASALTAGLPQIWFTINGGTNWNRDLGLESMLTGGGVFKMQTLIGPTEFTAFNGYPQASLLGIDPNNSNNIVAGGIDSGVFLSENAGGTWKLITDPLGVIDNPATPLVDEVPHIARPRFAYFDSENGQLANLFIGSQGSGVTRFTFAQLSDPVVVANNLDNNIVVQRNTIDPSVIDVYIDGVLTNSYPDTINSLKINGLDGNDTLTVNSTNGLMTIAGGIRFDGGNGFDRLDIRDASVIERTSETVHVGQTPGDGRDIIVGVGGTQTVQFENLEPVTTNVVAASFAITSVAGLSSLLQDDNQINYSASPAFGPTWGRVTVDNFEFIDFINKTTLTIDTGAGSDVINLNNPNTPTGLTDITVNGGDPTASDTLVVTGTAGQDNVVITPTGIDSATLTGLGPVINAATVEHLTYSGLGGNDVIAFTGTAGNDTITHTPGTTDDTGNLRNNALLALDYQNLGATGVVNVDGLGSNDTLVAVGTTNSDAIRVAGAGAVNINTRLSLNPIAIENLRLDGLEGDDAFNVDTTFAGPINVVGSTGTNTLTINGVVAVPELFFVVPDITPGSGAVNANTAINYTGISGVLLNGNINDSLVIIDTAENSTWKVGSAPFIGDRTQLDDRETVDYFGFNDVQLIATTGSDTFVIRPTGLNGSATPLVVFGGPVGSTDDRLIILGTSGNDAFVLNANNGGIGGAFGTATLNGANLVFGDVSEVELDGQAGNDTFNITALTTTSVFVDGGDPIGPVGDTLSLIVPAGAGTTTFAVGPENDEGSFTFSGGARPVSFDHIESVGPVNVALAGGALIVCATNGDDDIAIVGTGANSLTVSINGGLAIAYTGMTALTVQGKAGDEDIVVTVGPLAITSITVEGNDPTASDTLLIIGTPGLDTVSFTPTGISSGSLTGLGTPVNFATTEHVVYDSNGIAAVDVVTINGTLTNDTLTYDANSLKGNFRSFASPDFDTLRSPRIVVNGGAGGVDVMNLLGSAGADTVTSAANAITVNTTGTLAIVTLGAGIDAVTLTTFDGNDNINLSGITVTSTVFGGDGNDTIVGSAQVDNIYGNAGNDILVGGAANDFLYGEEGNDILGNLTLTPDGVADDAGNDQAFGGAGFDNFVWEPGDGADVNNGGDDGADIFRFFGNAAANVFTLRAGGTPTHFNALIGALVIDNHGIEDVIVDGQGGADTFIVNDLFTTEVKTINLNLGAADAAAIDAVTINGRTIADALQVTTAAAGNVSVKGLTYDVNLNNAGLTDMLTLNGNEGNDAINVKAGVQTVLTTTLNSGLGDDQLNGWFNTASGDAGNDMFVGAANGQTMDGGDGDDTFTGNGGTDSVVGGIGIGDKILVPGTLGNDTINLMLNALGHLLVTINGVTTTYTGAAAAAIAGAGLEKILVEAGLGTDTLTVDSTNGAIPIPITYDGGQDFDLLTLTGGTATSDIYSPGPNPGQGLSTIVIGGVTQTVSFDDLEPVIDLVAGSLVVNANDAANAISYLRSPTVATRGRVTIDLLESIEFSNKTTLTINALGGSDEISLNNPTTPTGLTGITVNGGDPTGSDSVIVNGTTGPDVVNVDQITADGARITGAGPVFITVTTTEHLKYVGQGNNDSLTMTTPGGSQAINLTPGALAGEGSITLGNILGTAGNPLLGLEFSGISPNGSLAFADVGGARVDELTIFGTSASNTFGVSAAGVVTLNSGVSGIQAVIPVSAPGVQVLQLLGLDGDDTFNVFGNHPFMAGIYVDGGDPSASDILNFTGSATVANLITADLGSSTITEATFGAVLYFGIETANINAANHNLTVNTGATDDNTVVNLTRANAGTLVNNDASPTVNFTNSGTFTVNQQAGDDTLQVRYTTGADNIAVGVAAGTISDGVLETVNFVNTGGANTNGTESIQVFGEEGNDDITVTADAFVPVFVDGGDPIGVLPGDMLTVIGAVGFFPGPENDEGGFITAGGTVSFDHIESLAAMPIVGCPFLIIGTDGDDDITVIARNVSTHAGTNGVQDFTVTVNSGPSLLLVNQPNLYIDAKAGDDDIVIRAAAPNEAAWDVNVRVAGGAPSIGEIGEGDRLVVETPNNNAGFDDVVFNPTGADTGNLVLDKNNNGTYEAAGTDSIITFGAFIFNCAPAAFTYNSSAGGVELIQYDGEGSPAVDDNLIINGTPLDDTTVVNPTGIGKGTFTSGGSPRFEFRSFDNLTVNPGTGGFDLVEINGTEGPDTVTSNANTVTLGGAVTIGAGIDQMNLNTFDGNDSVVLSLAVTGLKKVIDVGAGNDTVNLSAVAVDPADPVIFGGIGDDNIIGSPNPDQIFGGAGNDAIMGLAGVDTIYGEDGNDKITGGTGDDHMFGGEGSDTFIWNNGDNTDVVEGDEGVDVQIVNGAGAGDVVTLTGTQSGRILFARTNLIPFSISMGDVEQVDVNGLAGADTFTVGDLSQTNAEVINLNLGAAADADSVTVAGRTTDDALRVTTTNGVIAVQGLSYDVNILSSALADGDSLTVNGNEGNDSIDVESGVQAVIVTTLNGNAGNDQLSGWFNTANGGDGNDFIRGAGNAQVLNGGAGEDTMVGGGGQDTYNGGADFDTILIEGTSGRDTIDVRQPNGTTLEYIVTDQAGTIVQSATVAGATQDTIANVEEARIEAGNGADTIRVAIDDALHVDANAANSLRMTVHGGDDSASDRLAVIDVGTADLSILRQNADITAGTVEIGPAIPGTIANGESFLHVFSGIEFVQVLADTLAPTASPKNIESATIPNRLVVFKDDRYEHNNDRNNATHLGANVAINLDPTIDPGPGAFGLPADNDWYRVEALVTGTIDFQVIFEHVAAVGARPGLPGNGDLNLNIFDADGTAIATFKTSDDNDDNERARIPAVQGEIYYFQVIGDTGAINAYDVTVINLPAAVPFDLELQDNPVNGTPNPPGQVVNSDTGRSQFDNHTYDTTPTIIFRLDDGLLVNDLPGNNVASTPLGDAAIPIPFRAGLAQPNQPGFAIAIFDEGATAPAADNAGGLNIRQPLGFATQIEPGLYSFTVPAANALSAGSHFITARVQILDPANPLQTGWGERSDSFEIVVDTTPPPVSFGDPTVANDGLHPDSDSGDPSVPATLVDRITNDTTPTYFGRAEANSIVRVYVDRTNNGFTADDLLIGQTVATPLDGTNQHPQGEWSITSQINMNDPRLVLGLGLDGLRRIYVSAEDLSGNISAAGDAELNIFVDTQGPQVTKVFITSAPNFNLFTVKPLSGVPQGPTPAVRSLTINIRDLPNRIAAFIYPAINQLPAGQTTAPIVLAPIVLKGDHSGVIPIQTVTFTSDGNLNDNNPAVAPEPDPLVVDGTQPATGYITLTFANPLPDDRFTLTLKDSIIDPAGNALDGENNAAEPIGNPFFATGDNIPGGDFIARFTVDSRPDIATWSQGVVYADINGNFVWDPEGQDNDATNRDFIYNFGNITDAYFTGNFAFENRLDPTKPVNSALPAIPGFVVAASGFDKVGSYGAWNGVYQFFLDTNDDGVQDFVSNMPGAYQVNGIPVAGNFNAAHPGDEIGLFDGQNWYLDVNGNNVIDVGEKFATVLRGLPVVGDFNGDGADDLATFDSDTGVFQFDLNRDHTTINDRIEFGFSGFGEKPLAGDVNLDGTDDIVLWVPGREGQLLKESGEFHFLVSDDKIAGVNPAATLVRNVFAIQTGFNLASPNPAPAAFSPAPLGNDLIAMFGDDFALPLLGNFDPPTEVVAGFSSVDLLTNKLNSNDVNQDGQVTPLDALLIVNKLNNGGVDTEGPSIRTLAALNGLKLDTSGDGKVSPLDVLLVINELNKKTGLGEPVAADNIPWSSAVDAAFDHDDDETVNNDLLNLIAGV